MTYDCSKNGSIVYATVQDAINSVPESFQKGGMIIAVVLRGTGSYLNYYLPSRDWSDNEADWTETALGITDEEGSNTNIAISQKGFTDKLKTKVDLSSIENTLSYEDGKIPSSMAINKSIISALKIKQEYDTNDNTGEASLSFYLRGYASGADNDDDYLFESGPFSFDYATTTREGTMSPQDKQDILSHTKDLAAIHTLVDDIATTYLKLNGSHSMKGDLYMNKHSINEVTEVREGISTQGLYMSFYTPSGYEIAFGHAENDGADGDFEDIDYGGFKTDGYFYAYGFATLSQNTQGLLANDGTVLSVMTTDEVTAMVNEVFS